MNNFYEKLGEPVVKLADSVTKSYPSNEDLDLASISNEDGAVLNDAQSLARNRSILAGFLTLVMGGVALVVILLCFTKMGAKVRKKLKIKVSTAVAKRRAKRATRRTTKKYRRKKK